MVDTAPGPASASLRRDAILQAVADAAEWLLLAADWRFAAHDVIARLGIAAEVSRAYVIENEPGPDGATLGSLSVEWCAPGIPSNEGNEFLSGYDWEHGFGRFAELHRAGEAVMGAVADFLPEERPELERQGIVSLLELPVMVRGAWWGVVGFDDCATVRDWTGAEIDALRAAATLLGAAIGRQLQDEEVRRSERRYRQLVERLPGITYTDEVPVEGGPTVQAFVSPQVIDILGYPPERFTNDPEFWFSVMHPEDLGRLKAAGAFDSEDTSLFDEEYRMIAADGRTVWVHDSSIPIFAPDGSLEYFLGFTIDITERKLAEERQRATEQRYRDLVERLPAVTYLQSVVPGTNVAAATTYMSPLIERILGYPVERWYSDVGFWRQIVHPDDRELIGSMEAESEETGGSFSYDHRLIAADGRVVWVHEEAVLIRTADDAPPYWQGFILDITERKQAEEQLRQAEEGFRLIVERTPAVTYQEAHAAPGTYDLSTLTSYVSPQIEAITGFPATRWNEPGFWLERIYPEDRERVQAESSAANDCGEPYRQDYRMIAADGRIVWFHDESQLIRDDDGRPLYWQGVMVDITDRKEAEEQLRQAEERFRSIVERTPAIVYQELPSRGAERNASVVFVSSQIERILGYAQDAWTVPGAWIDMVHPDDRERVLAHGVTSSEVGIPYSDEYRMIAADGRVVWFHDEAVLTSDEHGLPLMWQGVMVDITDQKAAEERFRDAEARYRALVEHIPAVVYTETIDADPERFYISPQVEQVFGWTDEEWRWTPEFWFDRIHPDDLEAVKEVDRRSNETRQAYSMDYRFRHRDGRWLWVRDEAMFLPGSEDEGYWQGFLLDITERKEWEVALSEAELKFRTIVEQNQAIFYTQEIDPNDPTISNTTYIAPGNTEMIGYTLAEIQADPALWRRIVHPDDRERVFAADAESNRGESDDHFSLEYRMLAKDGRVVWVQDEARLVRLPGREPYWQGFLLDITERKQTEAQLERALTVEREAARRLRALDEMKNTFLQAVSHDLRTPLAAILGLAITLERGDVRLEEHDAKDLARRIAGNARRLDRLVTNLLDLDRLSRGIVAPKLAPTDLGDLARRAVEESELLSSARVRLEVTPTVLPADASKVERIIENLLANTARHTPTSATIWVRVHPVDDGGMILVEDNGAGVDEALREAIFEPFRQGPDAPSHSPGVGVGLTLVRRFAELHGGRAWVEARDGGGASFRVFLPADPPEDLETSFG
jgi:PAS domain S-box-containing protein